METAQDEDRGAWPGFDKAANGLDRLDPRLHQGKQDDVGASKARLVDRVLSVTCLADDLDSTDPPQESEQSLPEESPIADDKNSNRRRAHTPCIHTKDDPLPQIGAPRRLRGRLASQPPR